MFDHVNHLLLVAQLSAQHAVAKSRSDQGATAVEYALLIALIAGVIVLAVTALGAKINTLFTTVTGQL